ncbi:SU10 major capsid protein [Teichococcus vastitatis]|uniref:SU10 major capsid protein n=1 Tax=Teichococcus vastitatis TaxID=2307076 RepID=UPI000E75BFF4|nr:DUF5309 family protein [Pseudoroseomonas vastitatis]
MAIASTSTLVGKVEDVSDVISMIDPAATPYVTSIGSEKVHNQTFGWQEDYLDAPGENAAVEGAAAGDANYTPTVMVENRTQIMKKVFGVTGSVDAAKLHGRKSEKARQQVNAGKSLKRDQEKALLSGQAKAAQAGAVGAKTASLQALISADMIDRPSTAAAFTEARLLAKFQACYTAGGTPSILSYAPKHANTVNAFAIAGGRTRSLNDKTTTITNVVSVYESSFGTLKTVLNRLQLESDVIAYDPSLCKLAWYRPWATRELAVTGDSDNYMTIGEFGLKNYNSKGHFVIGNNT